MGRPALTLSVGLAVFLATALVAVGYTVATRDFQSFVRHPLSISLYLTLPLLLSALQLRFSNDRNEAKLVLYLILIVTAYTNILYCAKELASDALGWLDRPDLGKPVAAIYISSFAAVIGGVLFFVRLRLRFIYGLSEAIVGLAVSTQKIVTEMPQLSAINTTSSLAFLTAGVYLIVRGLDNMHQGLSKEPLDRAVIWLLGRLPGTEIGSTRSEFLEIRRTFTGPKFTRGRIFARLCIQYNNPRSATVEYDFLGRKVTKYKKIAFLALDDEFVVFRLTGSSKARALALEGAAEWDPIGAGRRLREWVAVPLSAKDEFHKLSQLALQDAEDAA